MFVALWLAIVGTVHAGKKNVSTEIPGALPELATILESAGWAMSPELSGAYKIGDIYDDATNRLWAEGERCFAASPRESPYTSVDVRRTLQGGVRVSNIVGTVGGSGELTRRMLFDAPTHTQLAGMDLNLAPDCEDALRDELDRGGDLTGRYVIVEVLAARILEQTCGTWNAKLKAFVVSADAAVKEACAVESLEPVAVAVKTLSVGDLLGLEGYELMPTPVAQRLPPLTPPPASNPAPAPAPVEEGLIIIDSPPLYDMSLPEVVIEVDPVMVAMGVGGLGPYHRKSDVKMLLGKPDQRFTTMWPPASQWLLAPGNNRLSYGCGLTNDTCGLVVDLRAKKGWGKVGRVREIVVEGPNASTAVERLVESDHAAAAAFYGQTRAEIEAALDVDLGSTQTIEVPAFGGSITFRFNGEHCVSVRVQFDD